MRECSNRVDLEKRCKMSIWSSKSALIQRRTDCLKSNLSSAPQAANEALRQQLEEAVLAAEDRANADEGTMAALRKELDTFRRVRTFKTTGFRRTRLSSEQSFTLWCVAGSARQFAKWNAPTARSRRVAFQTLVTRQVSCLRTAESER